jgi:hypothetical protein
MVLGMKLARWVLVAVAFGWMSWGQPKPARKSEGSRVVVLTSELMKVVIATQDNIDSGMWRDEICAQAQRFASEARVIPQMVEVANTQAKNCRDARKKAAEDSEKAKVAVNEYPRALSDCDGKWIWYRAIHNLIGIHRKTAETYGDSPAEIEKANSFYVLADKLAPDEIKAMEELNRAGCSLAERMSNGSLVSRPADYAGPQPKKP